MTKGETNVGIQRLKKIEIQGKNKMHLPMIMHMSSKRKFKYESQTIQDRMILPKGQNIY